MHRNAKKLKNSTLFFFYFLLVGVGIPIYLYFQAKSTYASFEPSAVPRLGHSFFNAHRKLPHFDIDLPQIVETIRKTTQQFLVSPVEDIWVEEAMGLSSEIEKALSDFRSSPSAFRSSASSLSFLSPHLASIESVFGKNREEKVLLYDRLVREEGAARGEDDAHMDRHEFHSGSEGRANRRTEEELALEILRGGMLLQGSFLMFIGDCESIQDLSSSNAFRSLTDSPEQQGGGEKAQEEWETLPSTFSAAVVKGVRRKEVEDANRGVDGSSPFLLSGSLDKQLGLFHGICREEADLRNGVSMPDLFEILEEDVPEDQLDREHRASELLTKRVLVRLGLWEQKKKGEEQGEEVAPSEKIFQWYLEAYHNQVQSAMGKLYKRYEEQRPLGEQVEE